MIHIRFLLLLPLILLSACNTIEPVSERVQATARGSGSGHKTVLISSEENTHFHIRELGQKEWEYVGTGGYLTVAYDSLPIEVKASPEGYEPKKHTLTSAMRELRFTFMIGERLSTTPDQMPSGM